MLKAINGYTIHGMVSMPIYDYVLACLKARVLPQRSVAEGAGVPFSTVAKIAQEVVTDPSVHTVQRLHDYFRARGVLPDGSAAGREAGQR